MQNACRRLQLPSSLTMHVWNLQVQDQRQVVLPWSSSMSIHMHVCNLQVPTACPTCTTGVEPASESCKEATAVTAPQVAPQIQTQYVVISIDLNERSHARTPSQHLARFRQRGWTGLIMGTHLQFQWNILHTFK